MNTLSFKQLFSLFLLLALALLVASALSAWTGPTATAPGGNVAAPINVGTTDQVKNAGISVNALTVFGSQYIQNKLGVGVTNPTVAGDFAGSIKIGNGGELCQAVSEGAMRYNASAKSIQYCNGTSWSSISGPSASFSVNTYGVGQTVPANTATKLTWPTEVFDTNNNFVNNRFTPTVPGKYLVHLQVWCANGIACEPMVYKNGSLFSLSEVDYVTGETEAWAQVTDIVDMNGTGDYLEAYIYINGGTTVNGNYTHFEGALLAGQ